MSAGRYYFFRSYFRQSAVALWAIALCTIYPCAQAQNYQFSFLNRLNNTEDSSYGVAINNAGTVVGFAGLRPNGPNGDFIQHAVMWAGATATDLGTLGGTFANAQAINGAGVVVGASTTASGKQHATAWNGASTIDLGTLGGANSNALDVNDSGTAVGYSSTVGGVSHATRWSIGGITDLGSISNLTSVATDINNFGQIVGYSLTSGNKYRATLWGASTIAELGALAGGGDAFATGINDSGSIVGFATNAASVNRAVIWNGTAAVELKLLSNINMSTGAAAINNLGQIVGNSGLPGSSGHATLWSGTDVIDLNQFIDPSASGAGWELRNATDINDAGWITGVAVNAQNGSARAFLLSISAVPEVETLVLMPAGLLLIFTAARRRKAVAALTLPCVRV